MLNVYHFIYRQYGFDFRPSKEDLIFFEWLGATNRLPRFLKWKTANILARAVGSIELVPNPFQMDNIPPTFDYYFRDGHLGLLRTDQGFHRMKLARRSKDRYAKFAFSLYQSKAASLPAADWEIENEVSEAVLRLTMEKQVTGKLLTPCGDYITEDDLESALDRTVDEVFPIHREKPARYRLPGLGACCGSSRREGGTRAIFANLAGDCEYGNEPILVDYLVAYFEGPSGVTEVRSCLTGEDFLEVAIMNRGIARNQRGIFSVPVGLTEPFKVRVITKGNASVYTVARDYQPRIWSALKSHPVFRLIGESLSLPAMTQFCSEMMPSEDWWIVSGDYKQATDHIPSHLAERLLERVCYRLGVPLEDVPTLRTSLTGHVIFDGPYPFVQESGQLMGSPTSFPILCLYNAALTRLAVETSGTKRRRIPLEHIPMLVNGDDLLLSVPELGQFANWRKIVKWGGLIPSIGKTLVSRRYGTINSVLYRFDRRVLDSEVPGKGIRYLTPFISPSRLPHVQLQLALGSMKSGRTDLNGRIISNSDPTSEQRMWSQFMDSCPHKERAWRFLFGANRVYLKDLFSAFPTASLCLPVEAGGLGFPPPPASSEYCPRRTPQSRSLCIAKMLLMSDSEEHGRIRSQWISALRANNDKPVENLLFAAHARYSRITGCSFRYVDEDHEENLPPNELAFGLARSPIQETDIDPRSVRRAVFFSILKHLRNYVKSGRGPCTLREVSDFLAGKKWSWSYGMYCSCRGLL